MAKAHRDGHGTGPSWFDVVTYMEELGREHDGKVHLKLCTVSRHNTGVPCAVWVSLAWVPTGRPLEAHTLAAGGLWPSVSHATFAGLLFAAAVQLQRKIEDDARDRLMGGGWEGTEQQTRHLAQIDPFTPTEGS